MNRSAVLLASLAALAPFAVEAPDSTGDRGGLPGETRLRLAGGAGYYAFIARGCEGQEIGHVPVHFREGGADLSHRLAGQPLRFGVRGGWIRDETDSASSTYASGPFEGRTITTTYVNPYVAMESPRISVGIGFVAHDGEFMTASEGAQLRANHTINDVSAHLLLGNPDRKYFAVRWMESVPLYSGAGYLTIGVGGRADHAPLELYGGFSSGGPYNAGGLFFDGSYELPADFCVTLSARGGYAGSQGEGGVSFGLMYRRRAPP